jgi:hypothetical protein
MTAAAPVRTKPVARCPRDGSPLDGGPVSLRCPECRRGVMAADALRSAPTHILTARGTGGNRANPVVYASPAFRLAYCDTDVAFRLALAARDGVEVSVQPVRAGGAA